jgi:glycosyltransferase involved in cell wall biosynthesis
MGTVSAAPWTGRIALVCDWYPPRLGGVEVQVHGLAHQLHRRGHDVRVITGTPGPEHDEGVPVHRLRLPRMGPVVAPDLRKIADIRALFERERIDLVHAHGTFSTLAIGGLLAAHDLGLPSVTTNHSLLNGGRLAGAWLVFRIWSRRATIVTAVSAAAARDAARASGRSRVPVLPNGIDLHRWQPAARSIDGPFTVALVGRLCAKKRQRELLRCVPAIRERLGGSHPVRFLIVGDGPDRRSLETEARRLGVSEAVDFLGARPRDDVRAILRQSHVCASMCRAEAFGLTLLEARSLGVPVVAWEGGASAELVEHGRTGLLVATRDAFVEGICRVATDAALYAGMRAAPRAPRERFDWPHVIARHLEVYGTAAKAARTQPRGRTAA